MSMLHLPLLYLLTGAVAGLLAGLLGVGGGLVIVPVLAGVFTLQQVPAEWVMHLAIGTSLGTIIVTSLSSIRAHHHRQAVRWDLFQRLTPGVIVGGWIGSWVASQIDTEVLQRLFALFELWVAVQLALGLRAPATHTLPGRWGSALVGTGIGGFSALVGIGGGTLTVPWLVWNRVSIHQAVGTSAAVGLPIALAGTIGFVVSGWGIPSLPQPSSGFLYWQPLFWVSLASLLTAPLGARLAHHLPVAPLRRLFAFSLFLVAMRMLSSL